MFEAFYEKLEDLSIVPVIVLEEASQAAPLAEALCRGGMPSAEVTFRTDAAAEAIRIMRQTCPEMCVGAGTVLTTEQAEQAIRAGASFVVSPGFDAGVVRYCIERDVPVLPGTVTPSEVTAARALGLTVTNTAGFRRLKRLRRRLSAIVLCRRAGLAQPTLPSTLLVPRSLPAAGHGW